LGHVRYPPHRPCLLTRNFCRLGAQLLPTRRVTTADSAGNYCRLGVRGDSRGWWMAWRTRSQRAAYSGRARISSAGTRAPYSVRTADSSKTMRPGRGLITSTREPRKTASSTLWVMNRMVRPVARQISKEFLLQPLAGQRVQGAEGLVHEDDVGLVGQHPRDLAALLHAAGELVGTVLPEVLQPHEAQVAVGDLGARRRRHAPQFGPELDVAPYREPGEQGRLLEDHPPLLGRPPHLLAAARHPPGRRR
jgi:hypothetical protein